MRLVHGFSAVICVFILSCSDETELAQKKQELAITHGSTIYESIEELGGSDEIKLHWVKVEAESDDSLVLVFSYTYEHSIPEAEVKLFVMPDHYFWSTGDVKVSRGTHTARVKIGLSASNMKEKNVTDSVTQTLRVRFEHYQTTSKYLGNIWGVDVPYEKYWKLK